MLGSIMALCTGWRLGGAEMPARAKGWGEGAHPLGRLVTLGGLGTLPLGEDGPVRAVSGKRGQWDPACVTTPVPTPVFC